MLRSTTGKNLGGARTGLTLPDGTTSHTLKRTGLYQALYREAPASPRNPARPGVTAARGRQLTY